MNNKGDLGSNEKIKQKMLNLTLEGDDRSTFEIVDSVAKPVISLWLIKQDLLKSIVSIEKAISLSEMDSIQIDELIISSLWQQAVLAYCKSFTSSNDGFSKLEVSQYIASKNGLRIHENLMDIRNSYLAHRGNNDFDHCYLLAVLNRHENSNQISFEYTMPTANRIGHYFNNYKSIIRHIKSLIKKVETKLEQKLTKIDRHLLSSLST